MDPGTYGHGHGIQFVQKKAPIRRPRKACTICRGLKTRCLPDGDDKDPQSCCSRCARLSLQCEYSRARRGRKTSDNEHNSPPSGESLKESHMPNRLGPGNNGFASQRGKWDLMSAYDNNPSSDGRMFSSAMLDNKNPQWPQPQPRNSLIQNADDHSPVMYPTSNGSETHPSPLAPYNLLPGRNPTGFTDYLNPQIHLIDGPQVPFSGRTVEENADRLTPEGFPNRYATPIDAGFISDADARQLFAFTANPARSLKNGVTDEDDRRKADIERTVFWCFTHDIVISHALQLPISQPSLAPTADQVYEWAESNRHLNLPSDYFAAFNAGLWEAHSSFRAYPRFLIEGAPVRYTPQGYAILTSRLEQHMNRFHNHPMLTQEPFVTLCKLMGDSAILKIRTLGWLQNLSPGTNSTTIIKLCEDFVDASKNFTPDELRHCSRIMIQIANAIGDFANRRGAELHMPTLEQFYRHLVQSINRQLDGNEMTPATSLQNFGHNQWSGLSAELASAPAAPVVLGDQNASVQEWPWTNVFKMVPSWDTTVLQ
ncbi:uncharacterized protein CcaverHIS019_0110860 [Cutaneotrichosporon cavernicola]|uniref:Zn(2)-C6 fungal-type domain-containing protein n=1 Tax=Cutaneotrichosporon cavernicola TaxID=279322 RepID=A0AA48II56_9TREE|nr:uncharacterized protein CcaverHIS019_0110860 [Cutaneotrichosporon cavernicola]BEI88368.1 hypothetical protein CcaverHIS019_0110860 [Cutaneotrichosporon cavernicola]BEI96141.1 hypothetical protein CcaverHIS631_0110900 [Cutaneotrichosporon cavernicola]BEJ03913.1 hypothetical protein CcaverHIS641_0110880 [Cutaneotrichosporon cavernicola]